MMNSFSPSEVKKILSLKDKTPCFLFEKKRLKKMIQSYQNAIRNHCPNTQPYYAIKSNDYEGILKTVAKSGFGLDASGLRELKLAKKTGSKKVIFTGPGKTKTDLLYAINHFRDITVHVDSFDELERLKEVKSRKKIDVGVRVNTAYQKEWNKFGIPLEELKLFIKKVNKITHLNFAGIHFHNSWNDSADNYIHSLELIIKYIQSNLSEKERGQIKILDIGGGLYQTDLEANLQYKKGVSKNHLENLTGHKGYSAQSIDEFFKAIGEFYQKKIEPVLPDVTIYTEPGRWMCSHCFHILLKVTDVKKEDLIILDGGTDNFGFKHNNKYYYPIINLSNPSKTEKKMILAGSLCSNYDTWGYFCFSKKIKTGDILLIPFQGAYTYSLRRNFIKETPEVIHI